MNDIHKDRLLKLADYLENKVKDEWLNMYSWASKGFKTKTCGSTACALGWATVVFPEDLVLHGTNSPLCVDFKKAAENVDSLINRPLAVAVEFFGISAMDAEYVFMPDSYDVAGKYLRPEVVRRLRELAGVSETRRG